MASDLVKRQHYVPRTYLKYFSEPKNDEFFISVLPKHETESSKIFKSNIKNVALEKHLYTLPGETETQKMAIEKFYATEIEQHYDLIYNILTDETKIEITKKERELIISTVITMFYRTTKWINGSKDLMSRVFFQMFELAKQTGKDYFIYEGERISIEGKNHKEFTKEFNDKRQPGMIILQLETAFKLINLRLQNDAIIVTRLDEPNLEYVTSDNPVIASNEKVHIVAPFDPENILYLPLNSTHKLMLMPGCPNELKHRIFRRKMSGSISKLEKLASNNQQMNNSERFMFGKETALVSYLDTKYETEKPMDAEESEELNTLNGLLKKIDDLRI